MAIAAKRWGPRAAILVLSGFALYGIGDATSRWFVLAGLAVVALVLWPRSLPRLDIAVLHLLGATVVAMLVVVGANVMVSDLGERLSGPGEYRLPILTGMAAAMLVFGVVAYWYLRRIGWRQLRSGVAAATLAVAVIAGLPVLVDALKGNGDRVPPPEKVVPSQLDLLIVTDGSRHPAVPAPPPIPTLGQFEVSYSVGVAEAEGVRWTRVNEGNREAAMEVAERGRDVSTDAGLPLLRKEADAALLLLVDGTPPVALSPADLPQAPALRGEVARWKRVVGAAAPAGTSVFAVLQTTDRGRLERWRRSPRFEDAVSAQAQGQTVADTGLQLAVGSSTAQDDFALAMAHRPVLLFDEDERFSLPLSADALFAEERVTLCDDRGVSTECEDEPITDPRKLRSGDTHLRLDLREAGKLRTRAERDGAGAPPPLPLPPGGPSTPPPSIPPPGGPPTAPPGRGSAIYVRPISVDRGRKHLLYLDYWWYLPGNPVDVGGGALCGAGLVIPGVTCQSHESDWEGLTVVVDRSKAKARVVAVHYAQHDSVVRYSWQSLRKRWKASDVTSVLPPIADVAERPLAFVSKGTHASYPEPCPSRCKQVATGFGEGRRDGNRDWAGNYTDECGRSICLQMLPTTEGGERPALWNAYTGQWGERHCRLTFYCDSGSPPTAPGNQERYEDPTQHDLEREPRPPQS